ncbi:hydroxypyruvate reductase [Hylemonella gracilis str. Niagara R]|uniref:Hydroxypyruvate reductase n=1 Tax=Hylemonella gracilis str. Niagara R TaxID=1458275 RepID=A0A016XFA6_9BURK|nr:glycerate kinase [Hylemonella gracilis]EYC50501.1 hydroxypyruvate reductase [Hylemonella gracilis str. Niagara R]
MAPQNSPSSLPPGLDPRTQPREFLQLLYQTAVRRALPLHTMAAHLPPPPSRASGGRTIVIGAGKAAGAMAQAVEALWPAHAGPDAPLEGLVVTRYGHTPPRPSGLPQRIEVVEAAHPVPDAAGMVAAQRILQTVQGLTADDLVLCLISGGGSALLTLPAEGLTLADKQRINRELLASGANIGEMNCVRKHLSRIKGGRLAAACAPARVVTLTISDVPGDDPSVIASGPTVPDASSCADALSILQRYRIALPPAVLTALEQGAYETPKPADPVFAGQTVRLIATPKESLQAAAEAARELGKAIGLNAYILSDELEGESREVGKVHAALARFVAREGQPFARPCVILSGGETTVTVRPQPAEVPRGRGEIPEARPGRGGRAGEFCLGLALALQGQAGVWGLAADTDGIDGIEDNAGAFVTPDTLARAAALGLSAETHLDRNDSYGYFQALGDLLVTGPTHTNVNDFRALLVL